MAWMVNEKTTLDSRTSKSGLKSEEGRLSATPK